MSSVQDSAYCPQCRYEEADYIFDCYTSESVTMCRRCGYWDDTSTTLDEDRNRCEPEHENSKGVGVS